MVFDTVYVQFQTHSNLENELKWKSEWGGDIYFSHGTTNSRGVMILFIKEIQHLVHSVQTDEDGRWIMLEVTVDDLHVNIINIYGPNDDNPNFFEEIHKVISSLKNNQNIIVGDFNTVLNISKDRTGTQQISGVK